MSNSALRQTTATLLTYAELSLFIPQLRALKTIGFKPARCVHVIGLRPKAWKRGLFVTASLHRCPLSPLPPRLPGSCSELLLWCKQAPPSAKQPVSSSSYTQKATVLSRVHYSIGQPCSSESTHTPLLEHRNNADSYSYPTAAYLAQCISYTCLLKVFKNAHVAFFACSTAWGDFSHHAVQLGCHPVHIARPLISHLQGFSLWLCICCLNEFSSWHWIRTWICHCW